MAQQRIVVTGATGNLGQDLLARLALFPRDEVLGTTRDMLNLTAEESAIRAVLDDLRPDVIINTAAFTQVDAAESDFDTAMKANASGPQALAGWVADHGGYLIHISTDYVFDGEKGALYEPDDPPHPISRYGESKLAGEQRVRQAAPEQSVVIRTSWLFGAGAKNFVPFVIRAAQAQTPIRVANDQWGSPTWTGNLCKMILETLDTRPTGILHGCGTGVVDRYEQARFLCACLNVPADFITPVPTEAFAFPARRPPNSAMHTRFDCALDWKTATEKFLRTQGLLNSHV